MKPEESKYFFFPQEQKYIVCNHLSRNKRTCIFSCFCVANIITCSSGTYWRGQLITHETWITLAEHCKERLQCHFVWCGIKKYENFISRSCKRVSFSDLEEKQKAEQYLLKVCRLVTHFDPERFKIFHSIDWKCLVWSTAKAS